MIDYPAVTHKIPECFRQKIYLDKVWADMKAAPVVSVRDFKRLRGEMLVTRDRCEQHIRIQKGGTGGAMG